MNINQDIDFAEQYAEEWAENSLYFRKNDHYKWMIEQLGDAKFIVEVGCGAGYSTYALAQNTNRKIFVIEANKLLLKQAADYLGGKSISLEVVQSTKEAFEKINSVQVVLLHANIFEIEEHLKILEQKFDALVCWLIGSDLLNISNRLNKDLADFEISDFGEYRENLHKFCYGLGGLLLKKNGICHMVDRLKIKSWGVKDFARNTLVEAHKKLATEEYIINFSNAYFRKSGNFKISKMKYVFSETVNPNSGLDILSSIKAIKA